MTNLSFDWRRFREFWCYQNVAFIPIELIAVAQKDLETKERIIKNMSIQKLSTYNSASFVSFQSKVFPLSPSIVEYLMIPESQFSIEVFSNITLASSTSN